MTEVRCAQDPRIRFRRAGPNRIRPRSESLHPRGPIDSTFRPILETFSRKRRPRRSSNATLRAAIAMSAGLAASPLLIGVSTAAPIFHLDPSKRSHPDTSSPTTQVRSLHSAVTTRTGSVVVSVSGARPNSFSPSATRIAAPVAMPGRSWVKW